jgi:phytoene desaturase
MNDVPAPPLPTRAPGTRAIVIGSGFGGLAAAVRLAARGWRVCVLERQDQPGGRAQVFRQDGFTFDAGPTLITAPLLFEELWTLAGRRLADDVDLRPVLPFFRIRWDDGTTFEYSGDVSKMEAEVARLAPGDLAGYRRFLDLSAQIFALGFERLADMPFDSFRDMLHILPDLLRLGGIGSVYGQVSQFVQDERLRQVLSFHPLLLGGNPFTASAIYSLIPFLERKWGVHFPIGGTGALVRGLVKLIESQGGTVRTNATVAEILVDDGRVTGVRLESGEIMPADLVVSNADSAYTYRHLLPARLRHRWTDRRLEVSRYSMGLFVWYFGTSRQYPAVDHHTILLGPRYRGLLTDIFERGVLADDFSLYLHRPTATDPGLAPPGHDAFYVLSPVPHLDADVDWRQAAEGYRKKIELHLGRTILPGLSDRIVTSRIMTPLHFRDELLSERGAGFGLEPILTQSAYFRPHNRSEEVDGLYLVGAGTHPGAGVPGVLESARILDRLVPDAA